MDVVDSVYINVVHISVLAVGGIVVVYVIDHIRQIIFTVK